MSRHQFEIKSDGRPGCYQILIDGTDIAQGVTELDLSMRLNEVPTVTLDLKLIDVTELGSIEAEVMLGAGVHDALVALGWTPPEAGA